MKFSFAERKLLFFTYLFILLNGLISIRIPSYCGELVDNLQKSELKLVIKEFLIFILIDAFVIIIQTLCTDELAIRISMKLKMRLLEKILNQDLFFFEEKKVGELVSRIRSDVFHIENASTSEMEQIIRNTVVIFGTTISLIFVSYQLSVLLLLAIPFVFFQAKVMAGYARKLNRKQLILNIGQTNMTEECFSNIKTLKSFAQEKRELLNHKRLSNMIYETSAKKSLVHGIEWALGMLFRNTIVIIVIWYGGIIIQSKHNQGQLTTGKLASFMMSTLHLAQAISSLTKAYTRISFASAIGQKIFQILVIYIFFVNKYQTKDQKEQIFDCENCISNVPISGKIEFINAEFSYPLKPNVTVLKDFSLLVQPGEVIGIAGESGVGKSTILNLLLRFYDAKSGTILIDDIDIKTFKLEFLRKTIGFVSQEPTLFSGTIEENICYGINNWTQEELIQNSKIANAYDFITNPNFFPDDFQTLIVQRGENISVGQKQRIAIARALMKRPQILLFDEATSSLDAEVISKNNYSEYQVQNAIEKLMEKRNLTIIIIAHRLSTIKQCDKIVVIKDGKIAEFGQHQSLLDQGGIYSELIQRQLFV